MTHAAPSSAGQHIIVVSGSATMRDAEHLLGGDHVIGPAVRQSGHAAP